MWLVFAANRKVIIYLPHHQSLGHNVTLIMGTSGPSHAQAMLFMAAGSQVEHWPWQTGQCKQPHMLVLRRSLSWYLKPLVYFITGALVEEERQDFISSSTKMYVILRKGS